ncbi:MAG: cytochrome c3 family protein [Pyrinomonadaceae bacterium]
MLNRRQRPVGNPDMKKSVIALIMLAFLAGSLFIFVYRPSAQRMPKPTVSAVKEMPEVIILGKNAKLGRVAFNHKKHNGGEYNSGGPILCIQCHHTAQPAADLDAIPPHRTVWPEGRTTTLTADLYAEDPVKAGVTACRDCHARAGKKPKLLKSIPTIDDMGTVYKMTNELAFHDACDKCHFDIGFRTVGPKVPKSSNCTSCHKKP